MTVSACLAQAPPAYPGTTGPFPGVVTIIPNYNQPDTNTVGSFKIYFTNTNGITTQVSSTGWGVGRGTAVNSLNVTVPSGMTLGNYQATYLAGLGTPLKGGDGDSYYPEHYYTATFQVVNPPPTLPPAGNPAFSWQGSVAGVNTGNGNKTTTLPIVGWTQRGGLPVSCTLYHNSQGQRYGTCGTKWQLSDFSYLTADGSGNETVYWDNGLSYTFTKTGTTYAPPYGVLDKLTSSGGIFTITTPDNVQYKFGFVPGNAYLSSVTDMDGNALTIAHNNDTTLSSVTDATGRKLTYAYSGGTLASVTDPLNRVWTFGYGGTAGAGNLGTVTLPVLNGSTYQISFSYDGNSDITSQTSPSGHASTFYYDGYARQIWAKDPLGSQTTFTYNSNNTVITDPNGHTTTQSYQLSRLASVTDALQLPESYVYDYNNILSSKTDRNNNLWYYSSHFGATPNSQDGTLPSTTQDAMGNLSTSNYDPTSNKVKNSADAIGNATTYTYSPDGKYDLTQTSLTGKGTASPAFQASSFLSNYANGQPTSMTDALNHSSSVAYDPDGQAVSATDAGTSTGTVTTKTLPNALGWTVAAADGLGHVTSTVYDAWGRAGVVIYPDSTSSPLYRLRYGGSRDLLTDSFTEAWTDESTTGHGLIPSVLGCVYPLGTEVPHLVLLSRFKTTGSSNDRLYATTPTPPSGYTADGNAGYVLTTQASSGWEALYQAYNGTTHIYTTDANEYNALVSPWTKQGIIAYVLQPSASSSTIQSTYDPDGNVKIVTDANAHTVTNNYDADDRLTQTTNGRGDVVKYTYDGPNGYGTTDVNGNTQLGLLSSKTDGNGHVTKYTYTARNEPSATFYPDGTSESVTYDNVGNLWTRTKADGNVIHYAYDADNRLTDITYPHLHATHFGYDADSRRISMTDATGNTYWDYTYDGLHMTAQTTPQGTVYYAFDADGRRTQMQLAGTGTWTYNYYNNSLPSTLQTPFGENTSWQYDGANRLLQQNQGNGAYQIYAYDAASQLTGVSDYYDGGVLDRYLVYTHDPAGNVQTRSEGTFSSQGYDLTTTYIYDGNDQLTNESASGFQPGSRGYTYDHNGNRLTQTMNGSAYQGFTYDAHDKMLSGTNGNETPHFDPNGNETGTTINGGTWVDNYDDEDRLISVAVPGGPTDTFTYNGLGLRVGKTDSTGTYSYVCDGTSPGSPILSDGQAVYTPGLSERRNGASLFYNSDDLGNLWSAEDGTGQAEAGAFLFTGFGAPLYTGSGAATASPLKYGGANDCQTDADTGLVLMGYRYYDTRTGRFISQDPAGDGDNWYAYAGNSPTNAIDPSGLDEIDCDRVPSDWQQQALAMDSDYNGEAITTDDNGIIHWSDGTNDHSYCLNDMSGGADWSASPWIAMGAGGSSSGGGTQAAAISSFSSSFSSFFMQGSMGTNMGGRMFAAGPPSSYEPGIGPNGESGVWKHYKKGPSVFEPDAPPPVKKKGHGDGGRNQGTEEGEHNKNAKGNRTPPSVGGGGIRRFNPLIAGIGAAGTGYLIYTGIKDGIAILGAPESGGASLFLLAVP